MMPEDLPSLRISVVICTHNRGAMCREAVESVLAQTMQPLEIICIDDASEDGTWAMLSGLARQTEGLVRPFRHERRRGVAAARNSGLANARGEWLCSLGDDDLLLPLALETLSGAAQAHPWADVIYSDRWKEWNNDPSTRQRERSSRFGMSGDPLPALFQQNFVSDIGALVRKSCLERIGGFREERLMAEDYEAFLRIAADGSKFHYVHEALAVYRRGHSSLTMDPHKADPIVLEALEDLLASRKDVRERVGARAVNWRMLALRFDRARSLLRSGDRPAALRELRKAWQEGRLEPLAWATRAKLLRAGSNDEQAGRMLRKAGRRFRDLSLLAAVRYARDHRRTQSIVHVVFRLSIGGVSRVLMNLLPHLQDASRRHVVLCLRDPGVLASDLERSGVRVMPMQFIGEIGAKEVFALRRWFAGERPDLVQVHIPAAVRPCRAALLGMNVPMLIHVHGILDDYWQLQPALIRQADKWAFRQAKAIAAVSEPVRETLVRELGIPSSGIFCVPNGVDECVTRMSSEDPDASRRRRDGLKKELGIAPDACVVGLIGRPCRAKRLPDFVKAAAIVHRALPNTAFVIVGGGAERHVKELQRAIKKVQAGSFVKWVGERRDIIPFLDLFDVGVLCSVREGFPLTILEYLAAGLPVVATDIPAHRNLIRPEENGLLVEARNPAGLAAGILRMLQDARLADSLANRATASVEGYTWENSARMMNEVYDRLSKGR